MHMHRTRVALLGAMALYAAGHATADASGAKPSVRADTAAVASGHPTAALPGELRLFVGDSHVIDARTERVAVGNGKVVSVSPVGGSQLVLIGHAPGNTVVQMWMRGGGMHRMSVSVAVSDLASTLTVVEGLIQGVQGVQARLRGDRVVLEGDAADARARDRAAAVAALYPGVVLDFVGKPGWEVMVHVDVRIVEFRRGGLRELGIRWRDEVEGPSAGVIADFLVNDRFRVLPPESRIPEDAFDPLPTKTGWRGYLGLSSVLDARLRMLEQAGEATLVAEPRLSCRSGGSARFVAGGEIPVPVVNGVGSTDVEYREYGVILDVKPIADASGAIAARIETELSQIDPAQRVAGIPGLLKRRSVTDVNLRAGETLVIAGLASRLRSLDDSGIPGLARVPVAGRLFGVRGRRSEDTEVVIFLTPRIAQPMRDAATGATGAEAEQRLLRRARDIEATDGEGGVRP
ncbi:MAG: type II and III secretion system protein family protein [Gammaproteobacteria bacterium]|jgi:pilus assembly protein CpaC